MKELLRKGMNSTKLFYMKNKPEIYLAVGILSGVGALIGVGRASLKAPAILEKAKEDMDAIHKATDEAEKGNVEYPEAVRKKDTVIVYAKTAGELIKLYSLPVALALLSFSCTLASHGEMKDRNASLASAYALTDTAFKKYRERVKEDLGEEADIHYRFGTKKEEAEVTTVDKETGEAVVSKKEIETTDIPAEGSQYARFFDEFSDNWQRDPELNLCFLRAQERYFNDLLRTRGYVFLNEVYRALGIPETKAGQQVGWVRDNKNGDGYISFGIYDLHRQQKRAFVNGYEPSILLDFNVDGYILDIFKGV